MKADPRLRSVAATGEGDEPDPANEPSIKVPRVVSPRRTEKVSEVIARRIVKDIVTAGLESGATLPAENQMVERFKVGRASLREALRILEVHGLITIKSGPGGGPIVGEADSRYFGRMATMYFEMAGATFGELLQARQVLEPMMARRAALNGDPGTIDRLHKIIDMTGEHLDDQLYGAMATEFHAAITGASGNRILDLMARSIKEVYQERISGMVFEPQYRKDLNADHAAVVEAIAAADPDRAESLMLAHMEDFAARVQRRYPGMMDEVVDWR